MIVTSSEGRTRITRITRISTNDSCRFVQFVAPASSAGHSPDGLAPAANLFCSAFAGRFLARQTNETPNGKFINSKHIPLQSQDAYEQRVHPSWKDNV